MPRTTREYLLRYADEALNDLQRALENFQAIIDIYQPVHPEYATGFQAMFDMVSQVKDLLTSFRQKFM